MAKLWIREFSSVGSATASFGTVRGTDTAIPVVAEPGTDQTPVTFSTSAQSAAFGISTSFIEICADVDFHYVVGANPTATTDAMFVPADTPKFIGVEPAHKIAAIAAS